MAPQNTIPNEAERRAFVEKVAQFRTTLSPNEQRLLDTVLVRAMAEGAGDVQGYGLSEKLVALLEEWVTHTVPLDDEGRPIVYGSPLM